MSPLRVDPVLPLTFATAVATLFLASVVHKARNPRRFWDAVRGFEVLPCSLTTAAAVTAFLTECAVVVLFLFDTLRTLGMLIAAGLVLIYAGAIGLNLWRGRTRIDCGCMGFSDRRQLGGWMVGRNALIAVTAWVACLPCASRELLWIDRFVIVCAALCVVALYAAQGLLAQARQSWQGES